MAGNGTMGRKPLHRIQEQTLLNDVQWDLSPADHKMLERFAREFALPMASIAQMALLGRLKADDGKGS
jgi:hypothetical protein